MQVSVLEYLEATARRAPDTVAVADAAHRLTFGELVLRARGLAQGMLEVGAQVGQPIAVFLPKSVVAVEAQFAALYAGCCYAPLDVKSPPGRLAAILGNLQPTRVVARRADEAKLCAAGVSPERLWFVDEPPPAAPTAAAELPWRRRLDVDPAYVIYTSGSTGVPKGVVISHRSIIDYIDWARACFAVTGDAVIGSQAPFYFDNSTLDLYLCAATGARLELIPEETMMFPAPLLEHLAARGVTFLFWVPSALTQVANANVFDAAPLPALRHVLFAGEVMPARTLTAWRRRFPAALFANLYGPTEITVDCTYWIVDRELADGDAVPIGFPCANTDVLVLDDQGRRVPAGAVGELCVRGTGLALGYWNAPELTNQAFIQNPLQAAYPERVYRTGDLVHAGPGGELYFHGRKDFQIKHLGYRIELEEIERAARALPGVDAVCALYDGRKQVIALAYQAPAPLEVRTLRTALLQDLPKYMVPTAFFHLERLPLNANGKVDRGALAKQLIPEA